MDPLMGEKSEETQRNPVPQSHELKRSMGLISATALGIGAMVGAGVFVLTGIGAGEAGPALLLAFFLNGIIALIIGGCYAELATMIPKTGGAYVWARPALGNKLAFFTGWCSWFAQLIACAFYAVAFGSFASELIKSTDVGGGIDPTLMASVALILLFGVNLVSTKNSSFAQILMAGLQMAIIALFVGFGISALSGQQTPLEPFSPFFPEGALGLLAAMGLTFIAFEGFEIIVQSSEEVRDPDRMIPQAIGISIITVALLYVLTAIALLGTIAHPEDIPAYEHLASLGELGLVKAAGQILPHGTTIILVAALASTGSALNATIYGATRVALAMARNRDLPDALNKVTERGVPARSLLLNGVVILIAILLLPIKDIAASADIMFIAVFMLVAISLLRLRRSMPDRDRPFRLPFSPYLPWTVIVFGVALSLSLYHVSLAAWIVAVGWLIIGIAFRIAMPTDDNIGE